MARGGRRLGGRRRGRYGGGRPRNPPRRRSGRRYDSYDDDYTYTYPYSYSYPPSRSRSPSHRDRADRKRKRWDVSIYEDCADRRPSKAQKQEETLPAKRELGQKTAVPVAAPSIASSPPQTTVPIGSISKANAPATVESVRTAATTTTTTTTTSTTTRRESRREPPQRPPRKPDSEWTNVGVETLFLVTSNAELLAAHYAEKHPNAAGFSREDFHLHFENGMAHPLPPWNLCSAAEDNLEHPFYLNWIGDKKNW